MEFPEDLQYSSDHEWVRVATEQSARVGVTEYATEQLGDIVFVTLPEEGAEVTAGEPCGELESTKTVEDLVSPVTGVVTAVNQLVVDTPETVNADQYGDGWLFDVTLADESGMDDLMDSDAYAEHVEG